MKKASVFLLLGLLILVFLSPIIAESETRDDSPLLLDCESSLILPVNYALKINATIISDTLPDQSIIWTSSNENVAIYSSSQNAIFALSKGNATITATLEDGSAESSVNVIVDEYDLIFENQKPLNASFQYKKSSGIHSIKSTDKNGCVSMPNDETTLALLGKGSETATGFLKVTPIKPGIDEITITADEIKTILTVYIQPYAFDYSTSKERFFKIKGTAPKDSKYSKHFKDCTVSILNMDFENKTFIVELYFENSSTSELYFRDVFTDIVTQRKHNYSKDAETAKKFATEIIPSGESFTHQIYYEVNDKKHVIQLMIANTGENDADIMYLFYNPKTKEWGYQYEVSGAE